MNPLLLKFVMFFFGMLQAVLKKPRTWALLFVVVVCALGSQMNKLRVYININDLLDEKFVTLAQYTEMRSEFAVGNSVTLLFTPKRGQFLPETLCEIRTWLEDFKTGRKQIVFTNSPFEVSKTVLDQGKVWHMPVLGLPCESPEIQAASGPQLSQIQATPWKDILTDKLATDVLIEVAFADTSGGSKYGRFDPSQVNAVVESINARFPANHATTSVMITGTATWQWYFLRALEHDQALLNPLMLLLSLLLFRLFFGSWRGGFLLVGTLIVMGAALFGTLALFDVPLDMLCNALFIMACVAGVEDFLFVSHAQLSAPRRWKSLFARIIGPGFFTTLSTMVGFASLCLSDLEPIRRFGFWAAYASGLEFLVVFFLLPALMAIFPSLRLWTCAERAFKLSFLENICRRRLPRILVFGALVTWLASGALTTQLHITD